MSAPLQSLFIYQVAAVVDESCLQQLFDGHVSKCVFGGHGLGRFAIVDFDDVAYRNMVLSQSLGGILLDKAIDEKSMLKALKRNKHHTVDPKKGAATTTTTTTTARSEVVEEEMSLVDFVASKMVREQEESQVNQIASIVSSTVLASMQSGVVASPTTKKGSFVHPDGKLVGDSLQSDINITLTATLMRMLPSEVDRATLIPTLGRFSVVVVGKCRLGITGSETSVSEFESPFVSGKLGCKFLDGKGEEEDGTPTEVIASTPKGLLSTVLGGVAAHREVFVRNNVKQQQQAVKAKPDAKAAAAQAAGVKRQREEAAAAATSVKAEEDDGTHHITFEEPTAKRVMPKKSSSGPVDFSSDDEEEDSLFKANNIENNPRYTSNAGQVVTKPSKDAPVSAVKTEARTVVKSEPVAAKKKPSGPVDFSSDDEEDSVFKANNIENNPRYTTNAGQTVTKPSKDAPVASPRAVKVEAAATSKAVAETVKVADEPAMNNRQRKLLAKAENKPTKMALKFEDDDDSE